MKWALWLMIPNEVRGACMAEIVISAWWSAHDG